MRGEILYFSSDDPTDPTRKVCWKMDMRLKGKMEIDSSDPDCSNTANFSATKVISNRKKIRNTKIRFKSNKYYKGVVKVSENSLLKPRSKTMSIVQWSEKSKTFSITISFPSC